MAAACTTDENKEAPLTSRSLTLGESAPLGTGVLFQTRPETWPRPSLGLWVSGLREGCLASVWARRAACVTERMKIIRNVRTCKAPLSMRAQMWRGSGAVAQKPWPIRGPRSCDVGDRSRPAWNRPARTRIGIKSVKHEDILFLDHFQVVISGGGIVISLGARDRMTAAVSACVRLPCKLNHRSAPEERGSEMRPTSGTDIGVRF